MLFAAINMQLLALILIFMPTALVLAENDQNGNLQSALSTEVAKVSHRPDLSVGSRAPADLLHDCVFSLRLRNIKELENFLIERSKSHPVRSKSTMTRGEVAYLTAPDSAAVETLQSYLQQKSVEIIKMSKYNEFITGRAPISTWEQIFSTQFFMVEQRSMEPKQRVLFRGPRALRYAIPEELKDSVESVFRTVQMPIRIRQSPPLLKKSFPEKPSESRMQYAASSGASIEANIPNSVTPALLNQEYNILTNTGNLLASQSVYESIGQNYSPDDLTAFQEYFNIPVQPVAYNIGGHNKSKECDLLINQCVEANLDVQYIMAVSQVTPTTFFYDDSLDFLLTWAAELLDMENPPLVNSISYGGYEEDLGLPYVTTFDNLAMMLAAEGVTIVASSGDDGAPGSDARSNSSNCGYSPQWPASSPYVLSVGATQGPESSDPEISCSSSTGGVITSGGGFSNLYPRPTYQKNLVEGYLSSLKVSSNVPAPGYNTSGRAYPDLSALGFNYMVMIGGNFHVVSGTSASAPVIAGMISLVNAARLALNMSAIGWINPFIYSNYSRFARDITVGDNRCCADTENAPPVCCTEGFFSAPLWDPVTGIGSIDFAQFYEFFTGEILPTSPDNNDNSLSTGLIAAVSVGSVAAAAVIGTGIYYTFFAAKTAGSLNSPLL